MDILTIDVGGTYIKYGLIDNQLNITNKDKIKTPYHNKEDFLLTLKDLYLKFKNKIEGIALSVPGRISSTGDMLSAGALTYLEGLELASELSKICDNIRVSVENDGEAAALCEALYGSAKDYSNSVSIIFGTGIGGGVILNKEILRGDFLIAGEFSLLFTDFNEDNDDRMASLYSTLSIVKKVKKLMNDDSIDGEKMMLLYDQNNELVVKVLDQWFLAIAKFCYNIDCLVNPDVICIGGGISANPLFVDKINEAIDYIETKTYVFRKPLVKCCQFHNDSNLIGAYCRFKQISGGQV